jgi:hypothetical protein
MSAPLLRVARPTEDDHDGFHGVMLGHPRAPWRLEFAQREGHRGGRAPTEDNLLVLYLPGAEAWRAATGRMADAGFSPVASFNPYWNERGLIYEDPDGYRVVLQNDGWIL